MTSRLALVAAMILGAFACGGSTETGDDVETSDDFDGDGISNTDEGEGAQTDSDDDGTPDYRDPDSDDDGIADYREAGDSDVGTQPVDSDGDGTPDFQDTDSDDNGRGDDVDGTGDADDDGAADYADPDDDGDEISDITELGDDPADPVNTDGDATPDFRDTDSDADSIPDHEEGSDDYDTDGDGNWRDTDSDNDCRPDLIESGSVSPPRDGDSDGRPDYLDRDSDDDGLPDITEDANCNGSHDSGETDADDGDTDEDGVSDLVEEAAQTDPNNPADNPQANGDFVFEVPYHESPSPTEDDLDFKTRLVDLDVYVLIDRSGSMSTETQTIKDNLAGVLSRLQCPANGGTGSPETCIANLRAGLGAVGYLGNEPFRNYLDIQTNPNVAGTTIDNVTNISGTREPLLFGVWEAITGRGSSQATGCTIAPEVTARAGCAAGTFGHPCFRDNALSVVALVTDEWPISNTDTYACPAWPIVRDAMLARSAKLLGIYGSATNAYTSTLIADLSSMATATGAVDSTNGNAPLVFNGADGSAASAIENGIRTLANSVPLDMGAAAEDDPADAVNAVTAFVDHLQTLQLGTNECEDGLTDRDTNADTFRDEYVDVRAGTPVCWRLIPKMNTTVPPTDEPQLFRATVRVTGDGVTTLDTRDVFFLVPPAPLDPPIG